MTSSRRTSSELASTAPSETKQRTSQLRLSRSVIVQLQKVAEQEEKELFLYSLREELINRAMNVIYRRYLEKQSVKFTVDCAYKALVQVLKTDFLLHDKGCQFYVSHPEWAADEPPEPSVPDSWAAQNVKIRPKGDSLTEDKKEALEDDNLTVLYFHEDSLDENE